MEFKKLEKQLLAAAKAFRAFKTEFGYGKSGEELLKPFFRSLEESLGAVETEFDFLIGKDTVNIDGKSFGAYAEAFVKQIKRLNATDLSGCVVNGSTSEFIQLSPDGEEKKILKRRPRQARKSSVGNFKRGVKKVYS